MFSKQPIIVIKERIEEIRGNAKKNRKFNYLLRKEN